MRRARTNSNRDLPMSSLERRQRGLLDLVKNRGSARGDPYLQRVANSRQLAMVRKIALWWRAVSLEAQCRLTAGLLKKLGWPHSLGPRYFVRNATLPLPRVPDLGFLASLGDAR